MKSGFYYTNPERKNPIKPLNQLFKYNFTIKLPQMAILIMVFFRMILLESASVRQLSKDASISEAENGRHF